MKQKGAYYNEYDKFAAAWLRELIKAGHIAPGEVDERSIEDVTPNDLAGFTQCHFFAGIGVWSYALRRAGWADDRPVWTGSCPCQPFSAAGKGAGFADERHLWPAFHHLIAQRKPPVIFGEQVASKAVDAWVDLVHSDLEAVGYAFGSVPFPSAGVGAPHIRDRNFWLAESTGHGCTGSWSSGQAEARPTAGRFVEGSPTDERREFQAGFEGSGIELLGGLADTSSKGLQGHRRLGEESISEGRKGAERHLGQTSAVRHHGPTNGFWRDADWLGCRDGKWRPVEPSTFPLAHGAAARVGRLRGYGNAINAEAATAFIESYLGR